MATKRGNYILMAMARGGQLSKRQCDQFGVQELQCPVQSPDLIPTEHLWDELEC